MLAQSMHANDMCTHMSINRKMLLIIRLSRLLKTWKGIADELEAVREGI